jgi:hypothetical protein
MAFCQSVSRLAGEANWRSFIGIHFYNGVQHCKDFCGEEISSCYHGHKIKVASQFFYNEIIKIHIAISVILLASKGQYTL